MTRRRSEDERRLPPGPRLPAAVQSIQFLSARLNFVPELRRRHGSVFTLTILPGPRRLVVFSEPAHIKEIFAGDPAEFHAGKGNEILRVAMGDHSVLLTDDAEHARARKLLMPAFTGSAVRSYRGLVETIAKAEVDTWDAGSTVSMLDRMNAITLEVILQVVFGVTDEQRLARLRPRVRQMVDISPVVVAGWLYPALRRLPPWRGHYANLGSVDELIYAEIAERRGAADLERRDDVLSRLLQVGVEDDTEPLSDAELRDQLVTLLLAGHETTASALSWTLHELTQNPSVLARAHRAADDGDDAYLEACLKEGMRLHPIIDFVARTLRSEQTIGGWTLPRGVTVTPSIMLAHGDDDNFPDHTAFRPERFTDGSPAPNTWIPFGGGVRRCIGAGFSLMEGTVVLKEVLQRFDLRAERPSPTRLRNITNVPKDGAPVRLRPR